MIKIIMIILILLCLLSCDYIMIIGKEMPDYNIDIDFEIQGNSRIEQLISIRDWIWQNILSKSDKEIFGIDDYWQTPEETVRNREGDCEDFCILFMWLCYQYLDIKPRMLILRDFDYVHAISKYRDYVFNDKENNYINGNYIYIDYYSWEDALLIAEYVK